MKPKPEKADQPPTLTKKERLLIQCSKAEDLKAEDKKALEDLAHNPLFQRVLSYLLKESDARLLAVGMMPLFNQEQINRAITYQGEARGLSNAVEMLLEKMAPEEPEEKPEGEKE